jgi:hypothetical protein
MTSLVKIEVDGPTVWQVKPISEVTFGQNPRDNLIVRLGLHDKFIAPFFHLNLIC